MTNGRTLTGESGKMAMNSKEAELDYCSKKRMLVSFKFMIQTAMTTRFRGPPIRPCRDEIKENAMIHSVLRGQVRRQRWPQGLSPCTLSFTV